MICVFRLRRDEASHVALIGEFNNWSTLTTPMQRHGDRWEAVLELPPGKHEYAYFSVEEPEGDGLQTRILCPGSKVMVPGSEETQAEIPAAN